MITANPQYTTKRICSLMVTHSCNLHCVYCFEKYKSKGLKFMSLNTAQKILNKEFEDFSNKDRLPSDRLAIEFFGGEPLLNASPDSPYERRTKHILISPSPVTV